MLLPLWYAIVLGIAFIIYPILLLICIKLYPPPKYSIFTRTISGLGLPEHKSAKVFNPTLISMGIIMIPFPYYVFQVLPATILSYIGIGAFFCVPSGLILVGIFPEHKETAHMVAAVLSLGASIISSGFLLIPILQSDLSIIVTLVQIIVLAIAVPLAIAAANQMPSYTPDMPIEKLIYNLNFWEWSQFIALQTWIVAIYINLLIVF
jgi:hypothetical membrane protein